MADKASYALCAMTLLVCGACGSEHANSPGSITEFEGGMRPSSSGGTSSGGAPTKATGGKTSASSGGANSGGTSSGSGGTTMVTPPPQKVLPCDGLADGGTWERIGPPSVAFSTNQYQGEIMSAAADPINFGTAYVGIQMSGLWKTTDCGATWVHVNTGKNGPSLDSGDQWNIFIDPKTGIIYTDSGYGTGHFYRSSDGGMNWDDITPMDPDVPAFVQSFSIDPIDSTHMVVGFHGNCTGQYAPMCIAETTDNAASWHYIKGPTSGWGEGAGMMIVGGSTWLYGAPFDALYYTKDAGTNWEKIPIASGCFYSLAGKAGQYFIGCLSGVEQSTDAHTWTNINNSKISSAVAIIGNDLYATNQNDNSGQPLYKARLNNLTSWTNVATPKIGQGASPQNLAYDPKHKVLYLAAWSAGLWRTVIP